MIGMRRTGGSRTLPSIRLGWRASSSCAALAIACAVVVGVPLFKPSPAQAQFSIGGFNIRLGGYRWHHHRGRHRYSRRHHREDDDTPDPEREAGSSPPRSTATGVAPDPGRRVSSGQPEGRPSSGSGRPEPRGPDLEPAK